ncbi:MAG: glycosyl hydrolase family 98 C-terminal domain-containing protein [Terriglobia bacterium]|jgi:hypothetical protein
MTNSGNQLKALLSQNLSRRDVLELLGLAGTAAAAPALFSQEAPAPQAQPPGKKARPLRRVISARHPLFMVEEGLEMWRLLPEDFRAHCASEAYGGRGEKVAPGATPAFFADLERAQAAGIPVVLFVQGDEDDGPPVRLEHISKAFEEFPNLIGCRSAELTCGPGFSASERSYLIDLIQLCGEHGGLVNWQEMGFPYERDHIFMIAGRDPELFHTLAKYGDSMVMTDKNNGWGKFYETRSLVLGMWVSGIVAHWGLNAEDWWWYEQGYGERFLPSKGRRGYARQLAAGFPVTKGWEFGSSLSLPDILYAQNVLLAIAGGATVYSFESPSHALAYRDQSGVVRLTPAWKNAIYPLLKAALDYHLIPEREQVLAKMQVAYQDSGAPGTELDAPGEKLYRPLYGGSTPDEEIMSRDLSPDLFPRTGRYYFLPVLPKLAPPTSHSLFPNIIVPNQFADAERERAYFDKLYPAESSGRALVLHINGAWFVTNPHENQNLAEDFRFRTALGSSGVELSGRLEPHSFLLVKADEQKLYLQASNYLVKTHIWDEPRPAVFDVESYLRKYVTKPDDGEKRTTTLQISTAVGGKPSLTYSTERGTVESKWDANSRSMQIRLDHNGPVELTIAL